MSKLSNKIEAHDRTISDVLSSKKYTVGYFQREYSWEQKHIEQLVSDLTQSFLNAYSDGDSRTDGENYNNYYLGPFVVSVKEKSRSSIIDGQQRLTSITLLLIYLNHLQEKLGINESMKEMIFSEARGTKSFNIEVKERAECLQGLFEKGEYQVKESDDESTINMVNRYNDIGLSFPEEIKGEVLRFFIDWLKYNVILVEIIAYSDDNAYTIFETMNDRGLNLTPTEMLKGFILSRFKDIETRASTNQFWKSSMKELHDYDKDEDHRFIQSWLRAKYADTIRPGKAGSKNEDFEKIGTRFHSWVRENLKKVNLSKGSDEVFDSFVNTDFNFYLRAHIQILEAEKNLSNQLEHVYYIKRWGIAPALSYPLMLAPLVTDDSDEVVKSKINSVARYIETFVVKRAINYRKFASSSIRYTMYTLVKEIRNKPLPILREILDQKLAEMDEQWDGFAEFGMHGQNKAFVKFLLSRISAYIDQGAGVNSTFEDYHHPAGRQFEVEHIWADKHELHEDEFEQTADFDAFRNRLGDLVLLPNGTNQSYGAKPYSEKHKHYVKENLIVQSLTPLAYENNPNFTKMVKATGLLFKAHIEFKKQDVEERQLLYQTICEGIWSSETPV
jgi:uncharacterized protein with ParB-like and HNH nuclease domain